MPGPREADPDEIHNFMAVLVYELLRLWSEGVVIATPAHPEGRLVRVALVGIICDKPAAHKLGGFGSHSHRCFCTCCWIEQQDKASPKSFARGGKRRHVNGLI